MVKRHINDFCLVCGKDNCQTLYKTISGQTACSLHCVSLLKANSEDMCSICGYPVWDDVFYGFKGKFFCSDSCKKAFEDKNDKVTMNDNDYIFEKIIQNDTINESTRLCRIYM